MHRYWAARFPGDYDHFGFDDAWVATYCHEIDFALQKFDQMLGVLKKFVDRRPHYSLWIATSMGQAATSAQPVHREWLLTDPDKFLSRLGFETGCWQRRPAMEPQVNLVIQEGRLAAFRAALNELRINQQPMNFDGG